MFPNGMPSGSWRRFSDARISLMAEILDVGKPKCHGKLLELLATHGFLILGFGHFPAMDAGMQMICLQVLLSCRS